MTTKHFTDAGAAGRWWNRGVRDLSSYAAETPALDLRDYLDGRMAASGVFFGPFGRARRRFVVDMVGTWDGNHGVLEEQFRFADGERSERVWNLDFTDGDTFSASAPDVEGAGRGWQCGNAALMRYRLRLPTNRGSIVVGMEDWFYLMEDGTLINRARMSKFGIKVGELVVSFRKTGAGPGGSRG